MKQRHTQAKLARERAVKERRALKQEKKDLRKQAAADAAATENGEVAPPPAGTGEAE